MHLDYIKWSFTFWFTFQVRSQLHIKWTICFRPMHWIIGEWKYTESVFSKLKIFNIFRCKVPECESALNNREIPYDQPWLDSAIPFSNGKIDSCVRYAPIIRDRSFSDSGQCESHMFNKSQTIHCSEYVYESNEKNIQTEVRTFSKSNNSNYKIIWFQFNIHCSDSYKLALIGTVGNIGRFICLPLVGFMSDRWVHQLIDLRFRFWTNDHLESQLFFSDTVV